jgi:predicted AlkP superfamily pyrophosphatase or phosphodiesterase
VHGTVVIVLSDHGMSREDPITTSRVITRLGLLDYLIEAWHSADRNRAAEVLVEANRWLRRHPFDVRVIEGRDRLRAVHPVDHNGTEEADGT